MTHDPEVTTLRDKVHTLADPAIKPEQVDMTITLKDGRKLHLVHRACHWKRRSTDDLQQLEAKFGDLADGILLPLQVRKLIDTCWRVASLTSAAEIAHAAVPTP